MSRRQFHAAKGLSIKGNCVENRLSCRYDDDDDDDVVTVHALRTFQTLQKPSKLCSLRLSSPGERWVCAEP